VKGTPAREPGSQSHRPAESRRWQRGYQLREGLRQVALLRRGIVPRRAGPP